MRRRRVARRGHGTRRMGVAPGRGVGRGLVCGGAPGGGGEYIVCVDINLIGMVSFGGTFGVEALEDKAGSRCH